MKAPSCVGHFPGIPPSGSALVISLLFITLIAVLVLGFLASMKLEISSATLHLNGVQAQLYAQAGTDAAVAGIRSAAVRAGTNGFWISQPGRIFISPEGGTNLVAQDLSSGFAPTNAGTDEAANLNVARFGMSGEGLVAQTNTEMRVRWIYILQDGSVTNAPPLYDPGNPAVGRFAYWADDECAKVNVNTAGIRPASNTNGTAHPSRVNLRALFGDAADDIRAFRATNYFFHSPQAVQQVGVDAAALARTNFFSLTHYNRAPRRNLFGQPRIMLTTEAALADGGDFIDILNAPGSDPGLVANLDPGKVEAVVNKLANVLRAANWPYRQESSFKDKFSPVRPEQIALNIVEYVRARESTQPMIEPIVGYAGTEGPFVMQFDYTDNYSKGYMVGNARGPRITEVGVYVPPSSITAGGKTAFDVLFKTEIYLPPEYGIDSVLLTDYCILNQIYDPSNIEYGRGRIQASEVEGGNAELRAGEYRTIRHRVRVYTGTRPSSMNIRTGFYKGKGAGTTVDYELETVPVVRGTPPSSGCIRYIVDPDTVPESGITSLGVDDPSLNKHRLYWVQQKPNTFGRVNETVSTLGTSSAVSPQQDADAAGAITNAGMVFPVPKEAAASPGQLPNTTGRVESVAELGFIHTGQVCFAAMGTPWRTLRLQPKNMAAMLPDWALLDMFSAPVPGASFFEQPNGGAGGQVNLNSAIEPFTADSGPLFVRAQPLLAVFAGAEGASGPLSDAQAGTIAGNIVAKNPAPAPNPGNRYGFPGIYVSRGEIAEIRGVADSGEASERLLRHTVDLLTTRSSTFTVYAIGQSIRQHPGGIATLGERRSQSLIEGIESSGTFHFRTVYSQNLRP